MNDPAYPDALPAQSRLHWFVIERVLGQGGFGITYLARDTNLEQHVAIKEYLPVEFATRMPDATIRSRTEDLRDRYRWGLERFIQEARTLARFDHPSIVRVHSVFEFNNTAYMVMRFEEGTNLAALLDRRGSLPEAELLRILLPILDGLQLVHDAGFIHRDIKPDNIHIGRDGRPVLLDFGSARQAFGNAQTLTILVAPGYAPFEQYYSDSGNQGPWTDIYGLGATCYRAIAGRPPLDAVSRSKSILGSTQDVLVPATVIGAGRYSGRMLAAIDHALEFAERDRPQTVAEWRQELTGERAVAMPSRAVAAPPAVREAATGTRVQTGSNGPVAPSAENAQIKPPIVDVPHVPPQQAERSRGTPAPRRTIAVVLGVTILAAGIAAYLVSTERTNEARDKIAALEKQIRDKDLADAARQRAAFQQKLDEEARQRREQEQQAQAASDKAHADAAAKRNAAERSPVPRAPADAPRVVEKKHPDDTVRPPPPAARATPATVPAASPTPEPALVSEGAPLPAVATLPVTPAPEPPKPTPAKAPVDQLADADRAIEAKRFADALAILRPLADAGNAHAQRRMGDAYIEGRGIPRDDAAAGRWYEKAALQGEVGAQVKLAAMYVNGNGVLRNNNLAYVWYGTAARLGSAPAKVEQEKIGALLQPAERAQADRLVESAAARMPKSP